MNIIPDKKLFFTIWCVLYWYFFTSL